MTRPITDDMTATKRAAHATQVEVTDAQLTAAYLAWCKTNGTPESFARAILALQARTILTQQPDNASCKSVQKRLEVQQPATPEPVVSRNPFASRCYTMSESHLSGHRLIVGFEKLGDAQDAHEWVARQARGDFTHPAPSVPDAAIDSAIYNQCPDFDNWHEGPSIDDIKAIVRAAMLHNP